MVLVDTSVWVLHLREGSPALKALLNNGEVVCHDFIIGEIACGNIKNRTQILNLMHMLPPAAHAKHEEVMELIEINGLTGRGLGYVDTHLVASAMLTGVPLWTLDKRLAEINAELGISFKI